MSTQTQDLKPTVIQHAPPSLLDEVIEETKLRGALGLFDLDRAAEQATQRVAAHRILMQAAIRATQPIHWLWFKDGQGNVRGRFTYAGAARIAYVFGITVTPKGPVKIVESNGKKTAEIFGSASSAVLGVTYDNIRAYRVQGEDFLGRPPGQVGDNDWLQSTQTALVSKGVRILSGLVTVSPQELAEVWGMSEADVVKGGGMGHGFSGEERKGAGQSAGSSGRVSKAATDPQKKMLETKANVRARELPESGVDGGAILHECIIEVCGVGKTIEDVTMDDVNRLVPLITNWGVAK